MESLTENPQPLGAILDYNLLPSKAIGAGALSSLIRAGFSCGDKTMLVPITDASAASNVSVRCAVQLDVRADFIIAVDSAIIRKRLHFTRVQVLENCVALLHCKLL